MYDFQTQKITVAVTWGTTKMDWHSGYSRRLHQAR